MENSENRNADRLLGDLRERAKELQCLYQVEEMLHRYDAPLDEVFRGVIAAISSGWQFPDACQARITCEGRTWHSPGFVRTACRQTEAIEIDGREVGQVEVSYAREVAGAGQNPFLPEEQKLLESIAARISGALTHRHFAEFARQWQTAQQALADKGAQEWMVIVELMRRTDPKLYIQTSRKMIYHLLRGGVHEAETMLQSFAPEMRGASVEELESGNRPSQKKTLQRILELSADTFRLAARHLGDAEILACLQKWIGEDKSSALVKAIEDPAATLLQVVEALNRHRNLAGEEGGLPALIEKGLRVALIRRFFSDSLEFINVAKPYIGVSDFYELIGRTISTSGSYGRLGGKSAGLFLARKILQKTATRDDLLADVRIPKTWYVTADAIISFLHYNNMEEITEQKYKDLQQVRLEYPNIVHLLKNSQLPPEIVRGLRLALDDIGDVPVIVRSSSLLEDRFGTSFSGKYKSLFLANRGSREERLAALQDAIAEVYASLFAPDPIEYRSERGLLDFHEEMGIMIQEVVGRRFGDYFLPAFAGVAFSRNEFRWSPRIRREDGLIRLVPGLGTRAVDRTSDDYPVLVAPGQPSLRVNVTLDETVRYAPKRMDVINLRLNRFETVDIAQFLRAHAQEMPGVERMISVLEGDYLRLPSIVDLDLNRLDILVTFDGLIRLTPFVRQIGACLQKLEEGLHTPVDIEFASDGEHLYLLQCRPQSQSADLAGAPIPADVAADRVLFTANRYISNGRVPDISHVVYVDPERYTALADPAQMAAVGQAVSQLNKVLPKRQFILVGPGRWGSRGDIKLGVPVTYSDFNNTAMLIEVARRKGNYLPELSFGTHFFQDLVEASIRYLPLYPDERGVVFREDLLTSGRNMLPDVIPDFAWLADVVRVVDVTRDFPGQVLRVALNAEEGRALAYLGDAASPPPALLPVSGDPGSLPQADCWRWRLRMAERIARQLDGSRYGVKAVYVFGSVKNATAGPASDIDLLVHLTGSEAQRRDLLQWLDGWSRCLAEMNYQRTGLSTGGLLDIHLVTDEDIARKTSYAAKIGAVTDAARPLPMAGGG